MTKKKTEDIEDAEIIVSDNKRQDQKNSYRIKSQLIVLYIIVLMLFAILAGLVFYFQRKITSDMQDLQSDINTLSPIVSLKTIEDKLGDLEISVRRENISRINEASRKIEDSLNQQLDSFIIDYYIITERRSDETRRPRRRQGWLAGGKHWVTCCPILCGEPKDTLWHLLGLH